jgi:hypothetical protein
LAKGPFIILKDHNQDKVDRLLQYILAVAGQETGWSRELGMIHLIKYIYLADLTYAKFHGGQTYTGLKWTFHHFGPWSVECYNRIEPALEAVGATKRKITSDKYDDFIRWSADDPALFEKLNDQMDLTVAGAVQKYVRKFGNDTYMLLDFAYKTEPMLNAAPEELLEFKHPVDAAAEKIEEKPKKVLTARQKKKQSQKILAFKERLNQKLEERLKARKSEVCPLPPRYDDVFFEGLAQLDQAVGVQPEEGKFLATFEENIWKSKARHDPELS